MATARGDATSIEVTPSSAAPARVRVRTATLRDLDAVVELRVALLREHPSHPIYGRLRPDVVERARGLFGAQLRSSMEVIFLAEHDPFLASLRGEPRFRAILADVKRRWESFEV